MFVPCVLSNDAIDALKMVCPKSDADTDVAIAKAYGVWGAKSILGKKYEGMYRTTFVIDESGVITEVIFDVDSGDHANQIMNKED